MRGLGFLVAALIAGVTAVGCAGGGDEGATTTSEIVFVSTRDDAARCAAELESGEGDRCNREIYVMNADGTGQRRLTQTPAWEEAPRWSPDGTRIAFGRGVGDNLGSFVMRADGTQQQQLILRAGTSTRPLLGLVGGWSPDGEQVVYADGKGVWVVDTDSGNPRRLVTGDQRKGLILSTAWSPDGGQIAFDQVGGGYGEVSAIWITNANGSETHRLTAAGGYAAEPAWSPGSDMIAYSCYSEATDRREICVMNADGSDQHAITNAGLMDHPESPTWSPDGTQIAFDSGDEHQIFVIDTEGGQEWPLVPITTEGDNRWPNWQR